MVRHTWTDDKQLSWITVLHHCLYAVRQDGSANQHTWILHLHSRSSCIQVLEHMGAAIFLLDTG